MYLQKKDLLTWSNWEPSEIRSLLELAVQAKRQPQDFAQAMAQKTLVMLFQKTSTRTRVSFEVGCTEMGGHAIFLDWMTSNLGLTEIGWEAAYLASNSHLIMARVKNHKDLEEIARCSRVPVINGCDDRHHPCQALSDMLTIRLDRGSLEGARLCYVGVLNNVANSLLALAPVFGVHLTLVCPIRPDEEVDEMLLTRAREADCLEETLDLSRAIQTADYIYTDTWVNMELYKDPNAAKLKEDRVAKMLPFQINRELLKDVKAKIMHDMPIHSGFEITKEMVEDPRSIIFEQASNRLPAQKAIMLRLLGLH